MLTDWTERGTVGNVNGMSPSPSVITPAATSGKPSTRAREVGGGGAVHDPLAGFGEFGRHP